MNPLLNDYEQELMQKATDIGTHAGMEAMEAATRVIDAAELDVGMVATFVMFGFLTAKMEQVAALDEWCREGMEIFTDLGKKFVQEQIKKGAH